MLSHAMPSLTQMMNGLFTSSVVACQTKHETLFRKALDMPESTEPPVGSLRLFTIEDSVSQADTVYRATRDIQTDILVVNCDNGFKGSVLYDFVIACRAVSADIGAVVFPSMSERYGYVDDAPFFDKGAEKIAISKWALAGAFYYRSPDVIFKPPSGKNYLSELFGAARPVKLAYRIQCDQFSEWGTPQKLFSDPDASDFSF